ncbi:signal transduction histidine kinase [Melghiribacillus thermohalophilus]|uniref:histidine kinase n=1 Tax=Melghiribacillus thermohalophilus TaxID=1324956 RepID=A0A4V2V0R9_9BACI|nr:sensor histidine kinase [Melghiribacillus thermohalophilus]TCT17937.1 signal transduction histidine kinase [Melghiribacillus thermohalophilus]
MKHFLKDMLPFILFFYSQIIFITVTALLIFNIYDIENPLGNMLYMLGVPTIFLIIFLSIQYRKVKPFYELAIDVDTTSPDDEMWIPDSGMQLLSSVKKAFETQHRRYETELKKVHHHHQQHLTFVQQWVHQMKTPLSVLKLTLQKEKSRMSPSVYDDCMEELEKMWEGLELSLHYARLDSFNRDFHVKKVHLKGILTEMIQTYKSAFIRNRVFPELNVPEQLWIDTDPKWFSFIMGQVTANAIKYSTGSGNKIIYSTIFEDGTLKLSIKDSGIGIPEKDLPRVFDPFFTGENGRKFRESTGMGLYLARQICEEIGHEISISSQYGEGTTVTINFPNVTKM